MKNKKDYFFFALLLFSAITYAQDIDYAKTVVKKLASPEFQGRGYTDNGNKLAAEYIISEYKRIGLKPIGNSYDQKFGISINTFPDNISLKLNDEILKPAIDYLIEASSPSVVGHFNILKTNRKGLDSKEKMITLIKQAGDNFIFIDNTDKQAENKEINKKIDDYIAFLEYSPQISCKGILIYTKEKLTWDNSTYQNVRPVVIINKNLDISKLTALDINIQSKFIKNYETQNILGYIKGSIQPDSFIVVTAHYDHLGRMGKEVYFPGANDNASGEAMILNLASHYVKYPPKYSMLFISFSAEEVGLLGSKEFTDHPLIKLNSIKFLVNFDIAGTGDEGIKVVNGSIFKTKFDLLSKINSEDKLLPKIDIRGEACISDHCYFYQKGVPCFYIYTQGGIKAYHDIYDQSETLPFTKFVDYCSLMIHFFDRI